jgi:osmotically inducible protein OsmC
MKKRQRYGTTQQVITELHHKGFVYDFQFDGKNIIWVQEKLSITEGNYTVIQRYDFSGARPSMKRKANAHWEGTITEGNGTLSTQSSILQNTAYSFKTRFENGQGTNPEELLAAAHAGCFSMTLTSLISKHDQLAESIDTEAVVDLDLIKLNINQIDLAVSVKATGLSQEKLDELVAVAKENCLISKILNLPMTAKGMLVSS